MPTPSHSSPRRASSGSSPGASPRPSRPAPRAAKPGGAPKSVAEAPKPDAGSKRRALKKKRSRQGNLVAWMVAAAITVVLAGAGAGIWTELQTTKGRVGQKSATLADLSVQLESGQRRLRALSSASGKERVLVENGFIKPGERLLLFPKDAKK